MLPKEQRLTKRGSFTYVYKNGQKRSSGALTLVFIKSRNTKIGFSINNKVGKAVIRNKLKRRLRAIVRPLMFCISPIQAVIIVRPEAVTMSYDELNTSVINLFEKSNLIKNKPPME